MKRHGWWVALSISLLAVACVNNREPAVLGVTITGGDRTIEIGADITLTANVAVAGSADRGVTWSSSDDGVATIFGEGRVRGVALGQATITATSVFDGDKRASIVVTVVAEGTGPDTDPPPLSGLRFDLSGAIGLQVVPAEASGVAASAFASRLVKVLADGGLEDTLAEGSAEVVDFFIRNGRVFVLFEEGSAPDACVLGSINAAGDVACVDADLRGIDIRSLQFDAGGSIYYRGTLEDGTTVIRRSLSGDATDYYVARDAIDIERFLVTRTGVVLAQGSSSGSLGSQSWIRRIDAGGVVTNYPYGQLLDHLPDGTLWFWRDGLQRFLLHDDVEIDPRPYCGADSARFDAVSFDCDEVLAAYEFDRLYRSADTVVALTSAGLFRYYPTVESIEVPIDNLTNGTLRAGTAVVAGYDAVGEPRAYVVNLETGATRNILGNARIDVLRILLELDRERVLLYGLDLDRNQPVLAEFDLRMNALNVADVQQELAESFEVLDWRVGHVPPEATSPEPRPEFTFESLAGSDGRTFTFDASGTPGLEWIDGLRWDFGDGTVLDGDHTNLAPTHTFAAPGTYEVVLTATSFTGLAGSTTEAIVTEGGGSGAPPSSLQVIPAALTFLAQGETASVRVVAFDLDGNPTGVPGIEWRVSDTSVVAITPDPSDPATAQVEALVDLGSAVITAVTTSGDEIWSAPVGVSIATVHADVVAVADERVLFPFVDLPPGADPSSFVPPNYEVTGGVASVAGFTEDEIAALLGADGTTLLYPAILFGVPPTVGEVLLGTGGSAIMGHVRSVETRAGAHLVQLAQAGLDDVFEDFVFSFNSAELEAQGVLTQSSWRGTEPAGRIAPSGAWIPIPDCEFKGGLTGVGIDATIELSLSPILEFDVELQNGRPRFLMFLVGVRGSIAGEVGVDLQGGVKGTVSCNVGDPRNLTMPLPAGPLATLLSAGAQFQPKFEVAVEASAGPRFGVSGSIGFESVLQAGFDIRGGEFENLSRITGEPTADFDLIADGGFGNMDFGLTPGYYFEGDVGIQLGGWTLEKTCAWTRLIPKVGDVCDGVKEALFQTVIQGSLGAELQTVWDSPRRVLSQEESESRMLAAAVTTVALKNDALDEVLKLFKFAPVELELASFQVDGPTLYRVFEERDIEASTTDYSGPVTPDRVLVVEPGESLAFVVRGAYRTALLPFFDTPLHAGEVWSSASEQVTAAEVTVEGSDTLRVSVPVAADWCAGEQPAPVQLHFLGFNRMLGAVPTASYLGSVELTCEAPVVDIGGDADLGFADPALEELYDVLKAGLDTSDGTLRLSERSSTFPFIWIALSARGTIAKIDTGTGEVLGEYRTSPDGVGANPSRTTVGLDGSVWAGNRASGYVVHVGLREGGQCVDRDGDGVITTSSGYGDVLPWPAGGDPADECILHLVDHVGADARHVAIDGDGNVWVGSYSGANARTFQRIDALTGTITRTEGPFACGGYGGLVDRDGVLWSAGSASGVLRWDPNAAIASGVNPRCISVANYGLAVDSQGWIWVSAISGGQVHKVSPDGNTILGPFAHGSPNAQGLAVDDRDHVWVSSSLYCSSNCPVGQLLNDGTFVGSVTPAGAGSTGVAVDAEGKVWTANINASTASRIDPAAGPMGADGVTPTGAVDLTVDLPGANPYNYSDMTGRIARTITTIQGTWNATIDSEIAGYEWQRVVWRLRQELPPGTDVSVKVRAADTKVALGSVSYTDVDNDVDLSGVVGRYLQVEVKLSTEVEGASPEITSIKLF